MEIEKISDKDYLILYNHKHINNIKHNIDKFSIEEY
jgi:hypothetical protein